MFKGPFAPKTDKERTVTENHTPTHRTLVHGRVIPLFAYVYRSDSIPNHQIASSPGWQGVHRGFCLLVSTAFNVVKSPKSPNPHDGEIFLAALERLAWLSYLGIQRRPPYQKRASPHAPFFRAPLFAYAKRNPTSEAARSKYSEETDGSSPSIYASPGALERGIRLPGRASH